MTDSDGPTAFQFKGAEVSIGEVLRAAFVRGDLAASASRLRWESACEAEAGRAGLDEDSGAIEALIDQFRYDRDLESAEEAEAWLDARGLDGDDLLAHFARRHWWTVLKDRVAPDSGEPIAADADGFDALAAEVLISGAFEALATGLARRMIASDGCSLALGPEQLAGETARFLERSGLAGGDMPEFLEAVGRDADWLQTVLAREVRYRERCGEILSGERLAQSLRSVRLPLTRFEIERIEFDTMDAAREAYLCACEDGLALEEVARETRFPFKRMDVLAEDLPEKEQQRLLCARIGEILSPAAEGGLIVVSRLVRKVEPSLEDARVRSRVERRVLNAHFAAAGPEAVRWIVI